MEIGENGTELSAVEVGTTAQNILLMLGILFIRIPSYACSDPGHG